MQVPTNYKMGSGLAATIMGQQAGLEAEQQGLENLYRASQVPTQMLEGAKAMDLLNNPDYMKATQQWQTTAAQGRVSEEQSKKAYNDLTLLTTQLQAYNGDINKQRSILMESFQKNGVPIDSPMAQTLLQKPLENTMVARDQVATTLSKTPTHMGEMEKQELVGKQHLDQIAAQILGQKEVARINASARFAKTPQEKEFAVVMGLMQVARDPNRSPEERAKAQQLVQDYTTYKQSTSSGFAGSTIGEGGIVPKSATAPQYNWGDQGGGAGGGTYNYVPGQPLQPVGGGAAPAQRNPPVAGRSSATVQDTGAPYIKQGGGGVVVGGNVYSMDEYKKLPISKQYEYADLPVK